ncbi:MAG: hypothetical protein FWD58_03965 [Firmicutes bacterium]|nr:hypothetical protein [Bacillota bacterium]
MKDENLYGYMKKIIITNEQIESIAPYIENLDEILEKNDYNALQDDLYSAIVRYLDSEYASTPTSRLLQNVYDDLYQKNDNHYCTTALLH